MEGVTGPFRSLSAVVSIALLLLTPTPSFTTTAHHDLAPLHIFVPTAPLFPSPAFRSTHQTTLSTAATFTTRSATQQTRRHRRLAWRCT